MTRNFLIVALLFLSEYFLVAQQDGTFKINVSSDTVLIGNRITLQYSIENLEGEFKAPELSNFRIVSGPIISSQFSSINGKVSQRSSYSYILTPIEKGKAQIGAAKITSPEKEIALEPVTIAVLSNPNGIVDTYGNPLLFQNSKFPLDSLSEEQKHLQMKLKQGKKYKI